MRKMHWLGLCLVAGLSLIISACSKNNEPPKSGIAFEEPSMDVNESDGTLASFHPQLVNNGTGHDYDIKLILDEPLAEKSIVKFSIGGTATKDGAQIGDFDIVGNDELLTIDKGATEATITIRVFEDYTLEYDPAQLDENGYPYETVILTLESVESGTLVISDQNTFTLNIFEDDTGIFLDWDSGDGTPGDVDMDLLLYIDGNYRAGSAAIGTDFEGISIPAGFADATYGMAYPYYSGSSNTLNFSVDIVDFGGSLNGTASELNYSASYTLDNLNPYDSTDSPNYKGDPVIVQTMEKSGFNYVNISQITVPDMGSRMAAPKLPTHNRQELMDKFKKLRITSLKLKK